MAENNKCPYCKSDRLWNAGKAYDKNGKRQRFYCRDCHKYTIKPLVDDGINPKS